MATKPPKDVQAFFRREMPPAVAEYFRKEGAKGGKLSGAARMAKLTPEQRSAIAKKAAQARWAKKK